MFKDHFSHDSISYSRHRPGYPASLFKYLASLCKENKTAWDCATGSGQSAVHLKNHFHRVIATDASKSQIANALKQEGIKYLIVPAEESTLEQESVDLITVAQALHWFELAQFSNEAARVLKKDGILATWCYSLLKIRPDIDEQINHLYGTILHEFWPAERAMVEGGYKDIHFPFDELSVPQFSMSLNWSLVQLVSYISTWSAVNQFSLREKANPIDIIYPELLKAWGNPEARLSIQWPLSIRVWKKP